MKHFSLLIFTFLVAQGHVFAADEAMSDAQKIRFCERVRDHALQTYYNRERGQPMKLFTEDGSDGARITNVIVKRIYAEPQISTPKKAEDFGRAKCNEMMGTKQPE
jgi:hypothetical protein